MDIQDALQVTEKIWRWLEQNPTENEADAVAGLNLAPMKNNSPLCEYASSNKYGKLSSVDCYKCPILELWPMSEEDEIAPCEKHENSPFREWVELHDNGEGKDYEELENARRILAKKIADFANDKLAGLAQNRQSPSSSKKQHLITKDNPVKKYIGGTVQQSIMMIEKDYNYPFQHHKYQRDAVNKLVNLPKTGLWASVGVGKTMMATTIALIKAHRGDIDHVIVVCPPILIEQWRRWLGSLDGIKPLAYAGSTLKRKEMCLSQADFIIMSIQILKNDHEHIMKEVKGRKLFFIIDECQTARNYKTGNHKLVKQVSLDHDILMMTATPISSPMNVFGLTRITYPEAYPSLKRFQLLHVAKLDFWNLPSEWVNMDLLNRNLMHNAVKIDGDTVLELPPILEAVIYYDLIPAHLRLYKKLVEEQLIFLADEIIDATQTTRLFHKSQEMVLNPSRFQDEKTIVPAGLDVLDECIDELALNETDEKLVVFANYRLSNEKIYEYVTQKLGYKAVLCYGGEKNQANVDKFLNDKSIKILVGSPLSIGVGINLQSVCRYIVYLELPLSPNTYIQSVGRVYRQGQKKKCIIKIAVANNTIQQHLLKLVRQKDEVVQKIISTKKSISQVLLGQE